MSEVRKPAQSIAGHAPVVLVLGARADDAPPGLAEGDSGVSYRFADSDDEVARLLPESEVIFHWVSRTPQLRRHWSTANRLRWIHVSGVGVDWALFPELVESDVVVTNCRGVFDVSIPEYVLLLMLALTRDLLGTLQAQRAREWRHRPTQQLAGQHLVVIGAGSIGRAVGRLAHAAGMSVEAVARRARPDRDLGAVHAADALEEAIARADFVVVIAPLTSETRGLVGASALAAMRPSARLINVGRGAVVDETALIEALAAGRIAGAALDALWEEPLPADHPLWSMPNVIISPHMAGDVHGWLGWFVESFLANLDRWLAGDPLENVVDKRLGYVPSH
jgi:phosphoglycerate dehydrogenase-like enzyme